MKQQPLGASDAPEDRLWNILRDLVDPRDLEGLCAHEETILSLGRAELPGPGVSPALRPLTRRRIVAAFELLRWRDQRAASERTRVQGPADVLQVLPELRHEAVEVFRGILLDARHAVLARVEISRGTLTNSLVHPREVFGPALRMGAFALIVAHNHPSGIPDPSPEDDEVTRRLVGAGELLGVPLLDHVIVGSRGYCSYRDRGGFLERERAS